MGVCVKKSEGGQSSLKQQDESFLDGNLSREELLVKYNECYNCGDESPSRKRCFSEQAWSVLLLWNEINAQTVEKPICDYCYAELRAVLMERMDEFDAAVLESMKNMEPQADSSA